MVAFLEAALVPLLEAPVRPEAGRAEPTPVLIAGGAPIAAWRHVTRGLRPVLGSRAVDAET